MVITLREREYEPIVKFSILCSQLCVNQMRRSLADFSAAREVSSLVVFS